MLLSHGPATNDGHIVALASCMNKVSRFYLNSVSACYIKVVVFSHEQEAHLPRTGKLGPGQLDRGKELHELVCMLDCYTERTCWLHRGYNHGI